MAFDINPPPHPGIGAFGAVPGAIGLPDPFGDISKVFPAAGAANTAAGTDILAQLGGNISPATMNALKLGQAQFGQTSGMGPLSGLSSNELFGNIAGFSEGLQQKGIENLKGLLPTIASTETVSPALQTEIAARNATFGAAPDPTAAASYARQLYEEYLNKIRGGAPSTPRGGYTIVGGPAGGTAPVTPRTPGVGGAGGGGGGFGLPAGGLPGSEDFFDWFTGGGIYDPTTGGAIPAAPPGSSQYSAFGPGDPFGVLGDQPGVSAPGSSQYSAFGPGNPFGVLGDQPGTTPDGTDVATQDFWDALGLG